MRKLDEMNVMYNMGAPILESDSDVHKWMFILSVIGVCFCHDLYGDSSAHQADHEASACRPRN